MLHSRFALALSCLFVLILCAPPVAGQAVYEDVKLLASDGEAYDWFGESVAVHGDLALVGAIGDDDSALDAGAVYAYRRDSVSGTWIEEAKLYTSDVEENDWLGKAVALWENVALIGHYYDDDNGSYAGAAYVFRRNPVTGTWTEEAKLLASDGQTDDKFGYSVAIHGDRALIGAYEDDDAATDAGAAYVFEYDSETGAWNERAKLLASDGQPDDYLGFSVSLSGNVALCGALADDDNGNLSGSAYVYRYNASTAQWVQEAKLLASDGQVEDWFGRAVSVSGDAALVGAERHGAYGYYAGAVYAFRYDPVSGAWTEEEKLHPSDATGGESFGNAVALQGDIALIGADLDDDNGGNSGSAYLFSYDPVTGSWTEEKKLLPSDGDAEDYFGKSVALHGEIALLGANHDEAIGIASGSAYVFEEIAPPNRIYVPDDHATIQAAIAAARHGATIIVRPGTYVEKIDFLGKAITVKSEYGPADTILDGNQSGSVVTFANGEGIHSVLDGFTVTNGTGTEPMAAALGGGIYIDARSHATIKNNHIVENAADNGAGIYMTNSRAHTRIVNNVIARNTANTRGGGIHCFASDPVLSNNTILDNSAGYEGGGVWVRARSFVLVSNTILRGNSAPTGPVMWIGDHNSPSTVTIDYSNVEGGQSGIYIQYPYCTLNWGAGMIDADPLLADPASNDFHLTYDSPSKDSGNNNALGLIESDFEGDFHGAGGVVDMGADTFHVHLYHVGGVVPGAPIDVCIVGEPGQLVVLAQGGNILGTPIQTAHGLLYMWPIKSSWNLGAVPSDGIRILNATVPPGWTSGNAYPFQSHVGAWGNPNTSLTNLMVLVAE